MLRYVSHSEYHGTTAGTLKRGTWQDGTTVSVYVGTLNDPLRMLTKKEFHATVTLWHPESGEFVASYQIQDKYRTANAALAAAKKVAELYDTSALFREMAPTRLYMDLLNSYHG